MSVTINWLHITDWHVGQAAQNFLWPTIRTEVEKDIKDFTDKNGGIDMVLFTGDLVYSGERKQYQDFEKHMLKLWQFFQSIGSTPKLFVVPGNHDLRRPDPTKSAVLALAGWEEQNRVRDTFWTNSKSDLRKCVEKSLSEFEIWLSNTKIPLLESERGILPGDSRATFAKDQVRVGIFGLNSTFLQLGSGDFEGKLALSARQLTLGRTDDYSEWLNKHHIRVLATHQPKFWLNAYSLEEFSRDISPAGRFQLHLCGHLHTSATTVSNQAGSPFMMTHQGTSFFGLDNYGTEKLEKRIHGYVFGQWKVDENGCHEKLWPRVSVTKEGGALGLVRDPKAYLDDDGAIHRTLVLNEIIASDTSKNGELFKELDPPAKDLPKLVPSESVIDSDEALKKLRAVPRFVLNSQLHHQSIRVDERESLTKSLLEHRQGWIVTDWGTGYDNFIASVIKSENASSNEAISYDDRVFVLRCDEFIRVSDIESGFLSQFGMSMQDFSNYVTACPPCCLIIDGVQPDLTQESHSSELSRLLRLLLDLGSKLSIIVVARTSIQWNTPVVEVKPLDLFDLKIYIQNHPKGQSDLMHQEALERLFETSGGLPVHIDRMLDRLQVASLEAVLDEEIGFIEIAKSESPLHKALQQAIEAVRKRDKTESSRGIGLLKALSLLTYGETIEQVRNFLHGEPFFPRDAELLRNAALIDVISLHQVSANVSVQSISTANISSPKILRVPKQVRDSVLASFTSEDKSRLLVAAGEFYFGRGWRAGRKPKLRKIPSEYRYYVAHGMGNEFTVLQMMITRAKDIGNKIDLEAAARLALHYCGVLKGSSRNRDLRLVTKGFLRILEDTSLIKQVSELHRLCGRASRLVGNDEDAIREFEASLEATGDVPTDESSAYALLELSESLLDTNDLDRAREVAQKVLDYSKERTLLHNQARAKLLFCSPTDKQRQEKMSVLEKEARSHNWISQANDLSLALFFDSKSSSTKVKLLDAVLRSSEENWNRHRAVVEKVLFAVRQSNFSILTFRDRHDIRKAYAYCHSQRLLLFNRCHEALWGLIEHEGNRDELYRLFRYSSYIWRMRGEEDTEMRYFEKLHALSEETNAHKSQGFVLEIIYYTKRATVLLAKLARRK